MALFTGIGDFFRGAFGEDEEEKRRRKQREAQEAAQRRAAQQQQPKPQPVNQPQPKVQKVEDLFKTNKTATPTPLQQIQQNAKPPAPVNQKKQELETLKQKHMAKALEDQKKQTSWFDRQFTDRKWDKRAEAMAISRAAQEYQDKYGWNNDPEVIEFQKGARGKIDESSKNNASGWIAPVLSAGRVGTGIAEGTSGLYDLLTPGEGTNRFSKATVKKAEEIDKLAKDFDIDKLYKTGNVVGEIASFFIPSTIAGKVASKFPKGTKITESVIEAIAKNVDDAGDAGKVRRFLADRMRKNLTLDEAIEETMISARYMGQNTAQGRDTSPASVTTDILTGIAGSLLTPSRAIKRANVDDVLPEEVAGTTIATGAEALERNLVRNADDALTQAERNVEQKGVFNATDEELRLLVEDVDRPAIDRKAARDEIARRAEEAELNANRPVTQATTGDPLDKPTFQHKQDIQNVIRREEENLNRFMNENPDLTPAQVDAARQAARERTIKLVEDLQASRRAGVEAIEGQVNKADEAAQVRAETNADVKAQQAAQTTPTTGEVVQSGQTPGSPEVAANDAYKRFNEEAGIDSGSRDISYIDAQQELERTAGNKTMDELTGRQSLRVPVGINNKTQGAVASGVTDAAGSVTGRLLASQNPIANFFGQALYGLNKKSTMTNAQKTLAEQVRGRRGGIGNLRDEVITSLEAPIAHMDEATQAVVKERVFRAFELYNNGQMDEALVAIKGFTPEERSYFDGIRELNILRNNLNRATMPRELIDQYANGMHMPRIFDPAAFTKEFDDDALEAFAVSQNRTLDLNPNKRRKQLEELSDEMREQMLRDPAQAAVLRTEIALHNKGVSDYASQVAMIPEAVADKSVRGFLEIPDNRKYGDLAGKWVRKDLAEPMLSGDFRFKSDTYKAVNTLLDKYQTSVMGKMENSLRKLITVYNPATRLGNRGANLTQGAMAGFNLPEMAVRQQHYVNVLKNGGDEMTRLARAFGAVDDNEALARFSGAVTDPKSGLLKRATDSYRDIDTAAKVSMFEWQLKRGATPQEAARFVNRALPNIGNSGEVYTFFSRLPVLGVPFRAIQPEVLRSLSSTASRHTVPFLTAMATYTTLQNMSWNDVPEEERAQIQERFGSGQTPFAGINKFFGEKGIPTDKVLPSSWSFNAAGIPGIKELFRDDPETGEKPVVDVDPRRLMGIYSINLGGDSPADSVIDQALKASPANIPVTYNDGDWNFAPQNIVGSRLFSPIYQAAIDRDFRGKSVQDPEGKIYEKDGTVSTPFMNPETGRPESQSDLKRVLGFLTRSYVPQVAEAANINDARKGEENFYGQKMNLPQAVARLFGVKGEEFDAARLQDMTEREQYFDEKAEIDKQVEGLSQSEAEAYKRLTGYYKLREQVPNEFEPGSMRYKKAPQYEFGEDKWKEYAAHPALYNMIVDKKQRENALDGKPIQPEFDPRLSEGFRRQLLQNKMVAPGDDAELDQRMYSSPEWDYYQNLKTRYKEEASKYYPEGDDEFVDELVKHQDAEFPTKPDILKQYSAAYAQYTDGKAEKPEWNDALTAAKEAYNKQTFDWTNNERKARGLPAIVWDMWNNPTFGYDETPSGFGFGFGGGNREFQSNLLGNLSNFTADVTRFKPVEAQSMPDIAAFFRALQAPRKGGRANVSLGARSAGQ